MKKRGRGRPALKAADRRDNYLRVRLTEDEIKTLEKDAGKAGESISDYARFKLLSIQEG